MLTALNILQIRLEAVPMQLMVKDLEAQDDLAISFDEGSNKLKGLSVGEVFGKLFPKRKLEKFFYQVFFGVSFPNWPTASSRPSQPS